jgi:hypothetical protein
MSTATMTMMTRADIRTELGWSDDMIILSSRAQTRPKSGVAKTQADTHLGTTTAIECWPSLNRRRERPPNGDGMRRYVLTGSTQAGRHAWADIGRAFGITAVATGRILEQLGYRFDKHVTDEAVAAGCGVRRWDGYTMYDDWHLERVVSAIRSAAQVPGETAVAEALAAAIARQGARERVAGPQARTGGG